MGDTIVSGAQSTSPTVLIVEDEPFLRLDVAASFAKAGWTVIEVASGEQAVSHARNGARIDVVFTDINLAGPLTGWDVGEAFRSVDDAMPVVYASGLPLLPRREVPGSLYFNKPYDPAQIVDACAALVRS
jgi:CheY-like chemotaxis protein